MPISIRIFFAIFILCGGLCLPAHAEQRTTDEIVRLSWKASQEGNFQALSDLVDEIIKNYGDQAKALSAGLKGFPSADKRSDYKIMSDVATAMFAKAETLMRQGKTPEAIAAFTEVSTLYPWAQAWDPSRGSYWSVKEKAQASIRVLKGENPQEPVVAARHAPKTVPHLARPGNRKIIDYEKYGKFLNVGTKTYHYQVDDQKGLVAASGEGIYPDLTGIYKDPAYKKALEQGRLQGSHWDFVSTDDLEAAFYKWNTAPEPWGLKLFYIGIILERAKMYEEAIKAYRAIIVYFPNTIAWTYWQTPWYPGQAAIAKIQHILRMHPELNVEFKGARIRILNSFDNDPNNDVTITTPGILRPGKGRFEAAQAPLGAVTKTEGAGRVHFAKYANGHWQLLVENKPYLIKGITYMPTKVGQSPDNGTLTNWMTADDNHNGIIDGPYEAWVDTNGNNRQDLDEPAVGDFAIMKDMGVNTIRLYHQPQPIDKELLRKMYKDDGLMVIMGDFLGKYALGSGASWADGTDYENPEHQKNMMQSVKDMVMEYKDEPFMLMWLLGNENNYGVASNADKKPEAYYKFVNDVAKMIKSIDPNHPVAICNGDTLFLDKFAKFAPDVDAYGANVYRGDYGFGSFWEQVSEAADKPAFITEYGSPARGSEGMNYAESQEAQASYHRGNWLDIQYNSAGYADGTGNAVGGVAFEWLDEWWKNYEPSIHDTKADVVGPFSGGYYYEEWFGLFGQGDGSHSPFMREPRKVFDTYKELWKTP